MGCASSSPEADKEVVSQKYVAPPIEPAASAKEMPAVSKQQAPPAAANDTAKDKKDAPPPASTPAPAAGEPMQAHDTLARVRTFHLQRHV